jgi:hypothetical protein
MPFTEGREEREEEQLQKSAPTEWVALPGRG